jgi:FkbH-like protein
MYIYIYTYVYIYMVYLLKYNKKYKFKLLNFIKDNYSSNHSLLNEELFDWQYLNYEIYLYIEDNEIVGFINYIKTKYQYKKNIIDSVQFAMTKVLENHNGLDIIIESHKHYKIICGMGFNRDTILPILKGLNYKIMDPIPRLYIDLKKKFSHTNLDTNIIDNVNCKKMEDLWINSTIDTNMLSIYRNESFWKWRYIENPPFKNNEKYKFYGNYNIGIIVFRREKYLDGFVIRILEIVPYKNNIWNGEDDDTFNNLLKNFCNWTFDNKISIIDFFCTHKNLLNSLEKIGFNKCNDQITNNFENPKNNYPELNYVLYFENDVNIDDIYETKSCGDMDRPNGLIYSEYNYEFNNDDKNFFSKFSRDFNPLHIDDIYSRRLLFGECVVHGCNVVIRALNFFDEDIDQDFKITKINVNFIDKTLYNINTKFIIKSKINNIIEISCFQNNKKTCFINLQLSKENNENIKLKEYQDTNTSPLQLTKEDIKKKIGDKNSTNIEYDLINFEKLYNFKNIDYSLLIYISNLSKIVGMHLPGLNSIFTSFKITYNKDNINKNVINYQLNNFNNSILNLTINGIYDGEINAVLRPERIKQLSIKNIQMTGTEFNNINALVLGGSRGIGELTTKILIAGGASVTFTYNNGITESKDLIDEINSVSIEKKCKSFKFNLLTDELDINILKKYDIIFYYITPKILPTDNILNTELLHKFNTFYNEKYYNLLLKLSNINKEFQVFIPSTVFIDEYNTHFKEYIFSKSLSEYISKYIENNFKNIKINKIRLKKMNTDQTQSIINNNNSDSDYIYLKEILTKLYSKDISMNKNINQNVISVMSSINIDTIKDKLRKNISKYIDNVDIHTYEYGQSQQNFLFEDSELYKHNPEFIFIIDRPEDIINKSLDESVEEDSDKIITYFNSIKSYINANPNVTIFIMEYFLTEKSIQFNCLNDNILNIFQENLNLLKDEYKSNIYIMKVQSIKDAKILDKRMWYLGKIPYADTFIDSLSLKMTGLILSMKGVTARLLVLDLDNTLWGGVVGEDGVHGIKIGEDYPGNIFKDFQKKIKILKERGIALAICSKNDINIVNEVFEKNKNMILKKEDFVYIYANWDNKFENIKLISENIGLGLKNILFIDDNPVEREQVKEFLPDVNVLELSKDPIDYIDNLLNSPLLEIHKLTESDKKRAKTYETKVKLDYLEKKYVNKEDFYKQLDLEIFINKLSNDNKDRCIQLINKTNQFNATSLRLKESDLSKYKIHVLGAKDKFNDYENMGVLITTEIDNIIEINNYLMSCRFLGKNLENEFIKWLLNYAKNNNFNKVIGKIIETERNEPIRNIYKNNNFILKDDLFAYNLDNLNIEMKEYIKLHDNTNNETELNLESTNQNLGVKNDNYVDLNKINNKILNVIKSIIDDDAIKIFDELIKNNKLDDDINYIPSWSSLKHIILINKLEETFKIKISVDQIIKIKTISDLNKLIE